MRIVEYLNEEGDSPFAAWFERLDSQATELLILVGGGTKKRQARDIELAKERWADYRNRKRLEQKGKR